MSLTLTPTEEQALTHLGLHDVVRRCIHCASCNRITHTEKQALGMGLHRIVDAKLREIVCDVHCVTQLTRQGTAQMMGHVQRSRALARRAQRHYAETGRMWGAYHEHMHTRARVNGNRYFVQPNGFR